MRSSDWSSDVCSSDLTFVRARFLLLCLLQFGIEPDRFENTQVVLREIQRFTMLFRTKTQLLWRVLPSNASLFPQQVEAVYRLRGRTDVGIVRGTGLAGCSEARRCAADRWLVRGCFGFRSQERRVGNGGDIHSR